MNAFDEFYPVSQTMSSGSAGMWEIGMTVKLAEHLAAAQRGDRERESKLINRLGQMRRNVASFDKLSDNVKEEVAKSVTWLRSVGRKVDFSNTNPAFWITARDGKTPRW